MCAFVAADPHVVRSAFLTTLVESEDKDER
jgi:hypothetical protein